MAPPRRCHSAPARVSVPTRSRAVGAGGMGEVYRARDTRLDRTVAIKVLPAHWRLDAEARQRFEREARAIPQLSHPHICALYDVGRARTGGDRVPGDGVSSKGETLADRLAKGPLPLDQALRIGDRDRGRAGQGAPPGHRPSRPEARQHHADDSGREAARLRSREGARGRSDAGRVGARPADASAADRGGHGPRHGAVHGARAARRQGGGRAQRHLRASARSLYEMATGRTAFSGAKRGRRSSAAILSDDPPPIAAAAAARAAGARPRRRRLPGQGTRGAVAERPRCHARADVDCRCGGASDSAHGSRCTREVA